MNSTNNPTSFPWSVDQEERSPCPHDSVPWQPPHHPPARQTGFQLSRDSHVWGVKLWELGVPHNYHSRSVVRQPGPGIRICQYWWLARRLEAKWNWNSNVWDRSLEIVCTSEFLILQADWLINVTCRNKLVPTPRYKPHLLLETNLYGSCSEFNCKAALKHKRKVTYHEPYYQEFPILHQY